MLKFKIFLTIIIFYFIGLNLSAQMVMPPQKPKLVIGIVIDQMHPDFMNRYYNNFSDNGFRKFIDNGFTYTNASYSYAYSHKGPDQATIVTGTTPRYHAITGLQYYKRKHINKVLITEDESSVSVGLDTTRAGYNANAMKATTLGDELILSSYGNSKVFSVSLEPSQAVLLAGHAANGAFWLDEKSGRFISSNTYMTWLPEWLEDFNNKNYPAFYTKATWDLLLPENRYLYDAKNRIYKDYSLPLSFEKNASKPLPYAFLKTTPFGNMLLKDLSLKLLENEELGKDDFTDILFVNFSSLSHKALEFGPYSIEMEDHYLRLDKEIEAFITTIEKTVGRQNVLFFLSGTQRAPIKPEYLKEKNIPSGYFKTERAMALLNTYLMAHYGQGKWVEHYHAQQVYLNRELINNSKIAFREVQDKTAEFMTEFTGVAFAAPSYIFSREEYGGGALQLLQESYHKAHCGDVLIRLEPGWIEQPEDAFESDIFGLTDTRVPLSFYGWKVGRGKDNTPVFIKDIVPTICTEAGLPLPNNVTGTPRKLLTP